MNVSIFSEGTLFWILYNVLGGFISESAAGLIVIAMIWLLLRFNPYSSDFITGTRYFRTLFASVLIAQIAILIVCGIYVAMQLKWALIPSFSETIRFLQDQRHFILLSALAPVGLLLCVFLMKKTNGWSWNDLGVRKAVAGKLQVVVIVVAAIALTEVIYIGWSHVSDAFRAGEKLEIFSSVSTSWKLFYFVWFFTITPLVEELLFRGAVLKVMSQVSGVHAGVVCQAIIFAAMHDTYINYVPIFLLGIVLGIVYIRTKSIWLPAIVHSAVNFLALIGVAYRLI